MQIADNFRISKSHWYGILPRRIQRLIVDVGIKLGFIHRYGKLEVVVNHSDGSKSKSYGYNILTDAGLKHLGDILTSAETTNIDIGFMETGNGTTTPLVGDTALASALVPAARIAASAQTRGTSSPFEISIQAFIGSSTYTRPQTINELGIFFTPDVTGTLFARGVLSTGVVLAASDTATLTYAMIWR
jgi:hypothetical protein